MLTTVFWLRDSQERSSLPTIPGSCAKGRATEARRQENLRTSVRMAVSHVAWALVMQAIGTRLGYALGDRGKRQDGHRHRLWRSTASRSCWPLILGAPPSPSSATWLAQPEVSLGPANRRAACTDRPFVRHTQFGDVAFLETIRTRQNIWSFRAYHGRGLDACRSGVRKLNATAHWRSDQHDPVVRAYAE